ncbi:hypothetical protein [Paenibacillus sp. 7541]|uniref:hypothetical protein n=1 Tax=Paenibacillus sp. 7541 TaxID=2026236 RepID=UPI000BA6972D|nr:hypothetical protein [Paenibacillus sp. 7541]PAK51404.1 hypothetical protein CHH75_14495 [Paenibacillus sp. 7541]
MENEMEQEIRSLIEEFNLPVVQIPENRRYWFLRTEGGQYYSDFFHNNFIAIGYNEIDNVQELLSLERKKAYEFILNLYDVTKPGKIYNQIERFYNQMSINDVVMIPGISSNTIAFGIIKSEVYTKKEEENDTCLFQKRRKVDWVKEVSRNQMDPRLYPMVRPHNTISNADQYGSFIDRTIHDFYIKGDNTHYIIDVKTEDNLSLEEFRDLIDGINKSIDIVNEMGISDVKYTYDDIKLKINVQSPGTIELLTNHWLLMLIAGGLIGVIFGVDFSILGQKIKTDGVKGYFDKISQQRHELKMKKLDQQHELEKLRLEHDLSYLKDKLALQFPNEKPPSNEEMINDFSDTEKKSE